MRQRGAARAGADGGGGAGQEAAGSRAVEAEALAVEAVDDLAVLGAVERDGLDDVFPAQGADFEAPPGRLEPVAEPGVALAGVVLDAAADLAADSLEVDVPLEDPVVEAGLRGEEDERELVQLRGRDLGAAE